MIRNEAFHRAGEVGVHHDRIGGMNTAGCAHAVRAPTGEEDFFDRFIQANLHAQPLGHARQSVKLKEGIESAVAKQITAFIRDGKFKVTSSINGDEVRVTSKSRDELQTVIAAVRAKDFPVALNFVNFRD